MPDLKPKKQLGQHWLYDEDVLSDMAELAEVLEGDQVVEVGPGLGTLTKFLLEYGAEVTAVEFDYELCDNLKAKKDQLFKEKAPHLMLLNEDILKFRFDRMPADYKVVANIPYYLTSNLIRVLCESSNQPITITLLIQKEVAERLCSQPGDMSLLSVWAQMYYDCTLGPIVPAELFTPPPKVDSQIVVMKRRANPLCDGSDTKVLSQVIKAGFSNKRKTLHNSLSAGLQISKDESRQLLEKSSIDIKSRPQELTLDQWLELNKNYLTR